MEKKMVAGENKTKRGLGRGLSALMSDVSIGADQLSAPRPERMVPVELIRPNPNQPRTRFDPEKLEELAASIREKGVIQPLIVRPVADGFQIVAGERRWRAAQQVQLHEVPVIVREMTDTEVLEIAIIENIQRADLNPIEEGVGYQQLIDRFGHTQEKLAQALGKSRSHIANMMRLTGLPAPVKALVSDGELSMGHARTLVPLDAAAAESLAREAVKQGWSVRQLEQHLKKPPKRRSGGGVSPSKDADTRALENDLSAQLGMRVEISHKDDGGIVLIHYEDLDQLDQLCSLLSAGRPDGSI
jgi:ParB family chromosome partitioning protein